MQSIYQYVINLVDLNKNNNQEHTAADGENIQLI